MISTSICTTRPFPTATALLLGLLLGVPQLAGCGWGDGGAPVGSSAARITSAGPTSKVSVTSASSTAIPTMAAAIAQLTPFLDAARKLDTRLHALARLVNAGVTAKAITISPEAVAAARALDPATVARTVPAGMAPRLLRATVLVYSELSSRRSSFNPVAGLASAGETLPRPGPSDTVPSAESVLPCLGNGAAAAARFEDDLMSLRTLAASMPTFPAPATGSKASGEVTVRVALVNEYNNGCDSCGGFVATDWPPVTWRAHRYGEWAKTADGTIGEISFWATYTKASGWAVQFPMC